MNIQAVDVTETGVLEISGQSTLQWDEDPPDHCVVTGTSAPDKQETRPRPRCRAPFDRGDDKHLLFRADNCLEVLKPVYRK